jgi:hypothetical protein
LSSSAEDRKTERNPYSSNDLCFWSLERKSSAFSAYSAVDFFLHLRRAQRHL